MMVKSGFTRNLGREKVRKPLMMDLNNVVAKLILAPTIEVMRTSEAKEKRKVVHRPSLVLD